jgi:hypothetical protein
MGRAAPSEVPNGPIRFIPGRTGRWIGATHTQLDDPPNEPRQEVGDVPYEPTCPTCATVVRPTWDWCLACGFDPEGLKPNDWQPTAGPTPAMAGGAMPATHSTFASHPVAPARLGHPAAAARGTALVAEARPQHIGDPDWLPAEPRRKLSYLSVVGLVTAILIALGGLIFVTVMVLHRPIGTAQADAMPAAVVSVPAAAAIG